MRLHSSAGSVGRIGGRVMLKGLGCLLPETTPGWEGLDMLTGSAPVMKAALPGACDGLGFGHWAKAKHHTWRRNGARAWLETPDDPVTSRSLQLPRRGLQMVRRCHRLALDLPPSASLHSPQRRRRADEERGECSRLDLLRGTTDRQLRYRRFVVAEMPP